MSWIYLNWEKCNYVVCVWNLLRLVTYSWDESANKQECEANLICSVSAGTGNTVIEAVRVLKEHRVQPKHIILLSLFSTPHGKPDSSTQLQSPPARFCLPPRSHTLSSIAPPLMFLLHQCLYKKYCCQQQWGSVALLIWSLAQQSSVNYGNFCTFIVFSTLAWARLFWCLMDLFHLNIWNVDILSTCCH